jgi:hypothetical protein
MKLFTKVTLVSAIAVSGNAMAMQAMDDQSLSAATGQDGITIVVAPHTTDAGWATWATAKTFNTGSLSGGVHIDNVYVHDKDGAAGIITGASAGAITIKGVDLASNGPIRVLIDADANGNAANSAVLNVKVGLQETFIKLGEIGVATSNRPASWGVDNTSYNKILNPLELHLGDTSMNIQLGAQPQGAMIKVSGSMTGGLAINNIELFDTDGVPTSPSALLKAPGSIYIGSIAMTDTGGTDLTVAADIDVSAAGLVLTSTSGLMDVRISDVRLGNVDTTAMGGPDTTKSLGDIELVGVNATGTQLIIRGH